MTAVKRRRRRRTVIGLDSVTGNRFFVVGSSHKVAPLAVRERLAAGTGHLDALVAEMVRETGAAEAVIVSTCNRFECYVCAERPDSVVGWLTERAALADDSIDAHLYCHEGRAAVAHLFRVVCGLDSIMLGETQIVGQVKTAFEAAKRARTQGKWLRSLYQATLNSARSIRHQSQIGQHAGSIPAALFDLTRRFSETSVETDPSALSVLFVGAGETIARCATHLSSLGFGRLTLANRNLKRAETVARAIGADALPLDTLSPALLSSHDIVVSGTASSRVLISKDLVDRALASRSPRPMLFVDLAVPRDIDPAIADLPSATLVSVDDLSDADPLVQNRRQAAADLAESMISRHVEEFVDWWRHRRHIPLICELRHRAETVNRAEVERALHELARGDDVEEILARFGQRLINKLLHVPIQALHDAADDDRFIERLVEAYDIDEVDPIPLTVTL